MQKCRIKVKVVAKTLCRLMYFLCMLFCTATVICSILCFQYFSLRVRSFRIKIRTTLEGLNYLSRDSCISHMTTSKSHIRLRLSSVWVRRIADPVLRSSLWIFQKHVKKEFGCHSPAVHLTNSIENKQPNTDIKLNIKETESCVRDTNNLENK